MRKIIILFALLIIQAPVFAQKEYSQDDVCSVLADFLITKRNQAKDKKDDLKQHIVIEEVLHKDKCFKRDFGVYVFYLSTVDPPLKYLLVKNNDNFVIMDSGEFLNYIFSLDVIPIEKELLVDYIEKIQKVNFLKNRIYSKEKVTTDGQFFYFETIVLHEY